LSAPASPFLALAEVKKQQTLNPNRITAVNVCCHSLALRLWMLPLVSNVILNRPLRTSLSGESFHATVATRSLLRAMNSFFVVLVTITILAIGAFAGTGTLTASGTQLGVTSQYLGVNEGPP
jgi:hypothetical protein